MKSKTVERILRQAGLLKEDEHATTEALTGGVSSLILKVTLPDGRTVCLKKALLKLKVVADWEADPIRNATERASLKVFAGIVPGVTPALLYENSHEQLFIMEFIDDAATWKDDLLRGTLDPSRAEQAGRILGQVHAGTSGRADLAVEFADYRLFEQLRIDPYLRTIARRHPDLESGILDVIESIDAHRECLVHGDYSPKNLLVCSDERMVILDHEVAVFSDPAFDPAFLLSHLFLKAARAPGEAGAFLELGLHFMDAYGRAIEDAAFADPGARVIRLLPMLLLARIDGKSLVDYLDEPRRGAVRQFARTQILDRTASLQVFSDRFLANTDLFDTDI